MNSLRNKVYNVLAADSTLAALGMPSSSLWPSAPESPDGRNFMVLRWGSLERGVGVANHVNLQVWAYDRDGGYGDIGPQLLRVRFILDSLIGQALDGSATGWVNGVEFQGSSDDLWDDVYVAATRYEAYRVTASGV